ncbi:MAG TPA: hypothetical protein GX513_08980 [Firmicutes bacterium]|nr:hypothetical protein [Bacillota bacterium]
MGVDQWGLWAVLWMFPVALGLDLLIWTVGVVIWPIWVLASGPANWPGAAFGALMSMSSAVAWDGWLLAGASGGAVLMLLTIWFLRLIGPDFNLLKFRTLGPCCLRESCDSAII